MAVQAHVPAAVLLVMILVAQSSCIADAVQYPVADPLALRRLRGATAVKQSKCSPQCFQKCKVQCGMTTSAEASQSHTYAAVAPPTCNPKGCDCMMCAMGL